MPQPRSMVSSSLACLRELNRSGASKSIGHCRIAVWSAPPAGETGTRRATRSLRSNHSRSSGQPAVYELERPRAALRVRLLDIELESPFGAAHRPLPRRSLAVQYHPARCRFRVRGVASILRPGSVGSRTGVPARVFHGREPLPRTRQWRPGGAVVDWAGARPGRLPNRSTAYQRVA